MLVTWIMMVHTIQAITADLPTIIAIQKSRNLLSTSQYKHAPYWLATGRLQEGYRMGVVITTQLNYQGVFIYQCHNTSTQVCDLEGHIMTLG